MTDAEHLTLTILGGPKAGTKFIVEEAVDNVLIGSDPSCGFCIQLPGVSPIHARLWVDLQGVAVYDTNSPRGLYVNDDRVVGQAPLRNGDILWLGAPGDEDVIMIQCRVPPRAAAAAPAPPPATAETVQPTETLSLAEMARRAKAAEPEPAASEFEVVAEPEPPPTVVVPAPSEAAPEPAASTFEMVPEPPTAFLPAEPPSAVPAFFEDETVSEPHAAVPPPPSVPARPRAPAPPTPPRPRAAAPSAPPRPAPQPVAHPVTPAPMPIPAAAKAPGRAEAPSRAGLFIGLAAVALIIVGGGAFAVLRFLKPAQPATTTAEVPATAPAPTPPTTVVAAVPTPEPTPAAEATPEVIAPVTEPPRPTPAPAASPKVAAATPGVPAVPTPAPKATPATGVKPTAPPPTQGPSAEALRAQQVADFLTQADSALSAHQYETAAKLYDDALRLDPGSARASAGKASAQAVLAVLRKSFVPGRTSVQSGKAAKGGVSGFESEDVSVAKAPDYSGRIEFEASPAHVKPGDSYAVKVYLVNDGKKPFKIGSLSMVTLVNGARAAGGPAAAPTNEVAVQQRLLLQEVPGVWQEDVGTWALEVVVTSNRGDTFKNQLSWR